MQLILLKIFARGTSSRAPGPLTESDRILINGVDKQLVYSKRNDSSLTGKKEWFNNK